MRCNISSGVYCIVCKKNGNMYIGSSKDVFKRMRRHFTQLTTGGHHSSYLQRSWNKHGADCFEAKVLLLCGYSDLRFFEQLLIDSFYPAYNMSLTVVGIKQRPELEDKVKRKVAAINSQRFKDGFKFPPKGPMSQELRDVHSVNFKRMWSCQEKKASIKAKMRETFNSTEVRQNRSRIVTELWNTKEYREAASAARKGNSFALGYRCTPEQVLNRKKAARISNMKRKYGSGWKDMYVEAYPEHASDVEKH